MNEEFVDGVDHKNFLKEEKSYLSCSWQLADEDHLLSHSLAKSSDLVRVDSDDVPTNSEYITRDKSNKIEDKFKMDISSAFKHLLRSVTLKEHREVIKIHMLT